MAHSYWTRLPDRKKELRGMVFCRDLPERYAGGFVLLESQPFRIGHNVSIRLKEQDNALLVYEVKRIVTYRGPADYVKCIPCGRDLDKAISCANEILDTYMGVPKTEKAPFQFTRKELERSLLRHFTFASRSHLRALEEQQRKDRLHLQERIAREHVKAAGFEIS